MAPNRSFPLFCALLVAVGLMRLFELSISRRRQRALRAAGMAAAPEPHFRAMVALHTGILIAAAGEAWWFQRAPLSVVSALAVVVFIAANLLRVWVIATLGPHWNVQIMDSAPLGVVTAGPFRFIRHPNYVAVFCELFALPLIGGAWVTAVLGAAAHVWVLFHRIRAEEAVLLANPEYRAAMASKPRFLPGVRRARRIVAG
jgi:methyltransferase